ncbi:MAG: HEAT repeat domain-containing protein [Acidobacteriota bacterium]
MKSTGKILLWSVTGFALVALCFCQPSRLVASPASPLAQKQNELLNEKWSPEHLYSILSSPNPEARENLYRAAFAAGPAIIPRLEAALKDDRTATFAAQTLAYIGGEKALAILSKLVNDPRNLDLRRFYYGALGGSDNPKDIEILLNKIRTSDREPDRTVTQEAILALSISSDPSLVSKLEQAEKEVSDPVVKDDIQTAATVIQLRAKYLASPAGENAGNLVNQAIRTYFMPALEAAPEGNDAGQPDMHVEIHVRHLT